MFMFKFLFMITTSVLSAARRIAFTLLEVLSSSFLAFLFVVSPLLTPPPLSGGTWSTISKIPTASFGTSGNLTSGGGTGTGTGGSNTGNGNGTSGQITKPNTSGATTATTKAATVVLGLVGVGMAVLGVLV